MKMKTSGATGGRRTTIAIMLLGVAMAVTGCGGTSVGSSGGATVVPASGATVTVARATAGTSSAAATKTPRGSKSSSNLDCQAMANAAFDLNTGETSLVMLTQSGGTVQNRVDSPFYLDTKKMRADLDVLVALPDPTDAIEISMMGLPSEAIAQFRQLLDIIDRDANVAATPAANGVSDQQLVDFSAKLIKMSTAINGAMGNACPNAQAQMPEVGAQATPLAASYSIGQTAQVGDLRVTLDRVVISPGAGGILPTAGNRFVFAYFTVENTGTQAFQLNAMTATHWEDAAGKAYYFDPDTIMLDPNTTNLDGGIEAGVKKSGAVGYLVPTDAGDLVWVFEDFKPNRAVFSVKASDMSDVGTPVTEPTMDAMRAGADATQTAFVEMVLGMATADAAITETPVLPEAVPTDVQMDAPTDTPPSP